MNDESLVGATTESRYLDTGKDEGRPESETPMLTKNYSDKAHVHENI